MFLCFYSINMLKSRLCCCCLMNAVAEYMASDQSCVRCTETDSNRENEPDPPAVSLLLTGFGS